MLTCRRKPTSGFTMIEMIVAMAIFAILVALTVPTVKLWIANAKVRAVADSLENGIRLAQAESVRLSRQVVFGLSQTPPTVNFNATTSGAYWAIQTVPLLTGENPTLIASGVLSAVGTNVTITAGTTANQSALCFNSMGRLVANPTPGPTNATCTTPTSSPTLSTTQPMFTYDVTMTGSDKRLEVQVAMGGQIHLCDTNQTLSPTNPYGC